MSMKIPYERWERDKYILSALEKRELAKQRNDSYWAEAFMDLAETLMGDSDEFTDSNVRTMQHLGRYGG